jgi:hypothetical protein
MPNQFRLVSLQLPSVIVAGNALSLKQLRSLTIKTKKGTNILVCSECWEPPDQPQS